MSWQWWIDTQRGYSDADLESALVKVVEGSAKPGAMIPMYEREMCAYVAYHREKHL